MASVLGFRFSRLLAVSVLVLLLAGCYESPRDVTLYEPGVYKGSDDPLMDQSAAAERQRELRQRFTGQQDR